MAKSIGSVYIDIEARTAKLEEGVEKAQKTLKGMQDKLTNAGKSGGDALDALGVKFLKFNLYAQISANLIQALGKAISDVNNNAEELGRAGVISSGAVAAIEAQNAAWGRMKTLISEAYGEAMKNAGLYFQYVSAAQKTVGGDGWIFGTFGSNFARNAAFGSTAGLSGVIDAATATPRDMQGAAVERAGGAGAYKAQQEQLISRSYVAQREADLAAMDRMERINALREQAAIYAKSIALDEARSAEQRIYDENKILELKAAQAQLTQRANSEERTAKEATLAAVRSLDSSERRNRLATLADTDKLAELEAERARLTKSSRVEELRAQGPNAKGTQQELRDAMSLLDVVNQIAAVKAQMHSVSEARGLAAQKAQLDATLATLSGEEKLATMANARYRLEEKLASIKDTGEQARIEAEINALKTSEGGERYAALERQKTMLDKYETARSNYAKAELTDTQKLADIQAKLAESRAKVDVPALIKAGVVLNKEQTAEYEKRVALMNELNATHARVYASDQDVAQATAALNKARVSDSRKALTDEEERATILREIAALEGRIATARAGGGQLQKLDVEAMREAAKLYERNAELIEKNRQKMEQFGESMLTTFTNGAIQGRNLTEIFKDMLSQLVQYILQQALIKPLAHAISPALGGLFSGIGIGTSAFGNPIQAGRTTLVGEKGPELVNFSSSARVDPTHRTMSLLAGGGSSEPAFTYAPVYNVAAGVTEKDLMPILRSHAEMVRSSITNDLARGGRRAAQFR